MFKLLYLKGKKGEAIMDGITQNNDTNKHTHTHTTSEGKFEDTQK